MTKIDKWRDADGRTADPYAGLRAAIEAGPTDGPWEWWTSCSYRRLSAGGKDGAVLYPEVQRSDNHGDIVGSAVNTKYIESADPTTIRTLLDEHDRLAGEAAVMRELLREAHGVIKTVQAESTEEADLLAELLRGMEGAIVPNFGGNRP
jgi:hypothetical protein